MTAVCATSGVTIGTSRRATLRNSRGTAGLPRSSGASQAAAAQMAMIASNVRGRENHAAPPAVTRAAAAITMSMAMAQCTWPNVAGDAPTAARGGTSMVSVAAATTTMPDTTRPNRTIVAVILDLQFPPFESAR